MFIAVTRWQYTRDAMQFYLVDLLILLLLFRGLLVLPLGLPLPASSSSCKLPRLAPDVSARFLGGDLLPLRLAGEWLLRLRDRERDPDDECSRLSDDEDRELRESELSLLLDLDLGDREPLELELPDDADSERLRFV